MNLRKILIAAWQVCCRSYCVFSTALLRCRLYANSVDVGSSFRANGIVGLYVHYDAHFSIGNSCRFNSGRLFNPVGSSQTMGLYVYKSASLTIGDSVAISNCIICCANKISIGDGVMIGGGVRIYDTDFHDLDAGGRISKEAEVIKTSPICLESKCFIGAHSLILKGVTVGEESIVAAGSIVVKDIPPKEIWGGNPARFIRDI